MHNLPHKIFSHSYPIRLQIRTYPLCCAWRCEILQCLQQINEFILFLCHCSINIQLFYLSLLTTVSPFTSTSRAFAISLKVSKLGCMVFVHHFETVPGSFPSCSANHLLVCFFLPKPPLADFISLPYNLYCRYLMQS